MQLTLLLGFIGFWQIVMVIAILLLIFGGKKIPELMRGIGEGVKEFKDVTKKEDQETKS